MSGFSEKEIRALEKFRHKISDVIPDDPFSKRDDSLIRWIRAREMDLDKAEEMYRNSLEWRAKHKIDSILEDGLDNEMVEKFPFYLDGTCKQGRPVITICYGAWDLRTFIESDEDGISKFARYSHQMLESIGAAIKKKTLEAEENGQEQECVQIVAISNMAGYSYRQMANMKAVQALINQVSIYEAHYPETLGQIIIINAPAVFSVLYGMMKPFMSSRTIEKIQVFSENKEQWLPAVLKLVDEAEIREEFGGTKVVTDF